IPASRKQTGRQGKSLLRALARRRLPSRLWQLPKRGFTAPIGEWIAGEQSAQFRQEMLNSGALVASHIDLRELGRHFEANHTEGGNHGYPLWAAWVLERWLRGTLAHRLQPVTSDKNLRRQQVARPN